MDLSWWHALDPAWQDIFRKTLGYDLASWGDHVPSLDELAALATATHVNAAHSSITSLAPLGALSKLTVVDFGDCTQLTRYDGLPPSVESLSFHWTEMTDLTWVDALPNLKRVACDMPLQSRINRRISANRRKRQ